MRKCYSCHTYIADPTGKSSCGSCNMIWCNPDCFVQDILHTHVCSGASCWSRFTARLEKAGESRVPKKGTDVVKFSNGSLAIPLVIGDDEDPATAWIGGTDNPLPPGIIDIRHKLQDDKRISYLLETKAESRDIATLETERQRLISENKFLYLPSWEIVPVFTIATQIPKLAATLVLSMKLGLERMGGAHCVSE